MSALDDAKVFAEEAPPDNRHINAVLYWYILLTITINGPDLSTDLKQLQNAIEARKVADDFCKAIDIAPPRTDLRLGRETVVKYYTSAAAEVGEVIAKAGPEDNQIVSPEN
ncbi:hypothetical protein H0H87_012054 [Tephrocybe sp. NHM501043]|nr:hypothetical protein H0H87_012054 [Tephrocybe sp. NHM501043]